MMKQKDKGTPPLNPPLNGGMNSKIFLIGGIAL